MLEEYVIHNHAVELSLPEISISTTFIKNCKERKLWAHGGLWYNNLKQFKIRYVNSALEIRSEGKSKNHLFILFLFKSLQAKASVDFTEKSNKEEDTK